MKKIFFVVLVTSATFFSRANACDICGCGVGNYYIGLLPQFNHKFFGLRYHFSGFTTHLNGDATQFSKDFYQTIEWWGGWNLGKRFQLLAFVPYNFNHQNSDDGVANKEGLGDVMVLANYKVLDVHSVNGSNIRTSQQLWIGAGFKLPTGKFNIDPSDPDIAAIANGQLGSGSTDFLFNAIYNLRINRFGISTTASYKMNSANRENYKFGDRFSASSFGFYSIPISGALINPNLGLLYQSTKSSQLQNSKIDLTGGTVLNGAAGAEISFHRITTGFNVQLPISQNFAANQTKEKLKGMIHVTVAF